jgi:hypothetical protein
MLVTSEGDEIVREDMENLPSEVLLGQDHQDLYHGYIGHTEYEDIVVNGTLNNFLGYFCNPCPFIQETDALNLPLNFTPALAEESTATVGSFNSFETVYSRILPFTTREAVLM